MPYPDRFYPVVDSVAWVARLTALGVGTIQLRAKNLNDGEALQIVSDALEVTKGTPTKLVVNDYWRAAIVAGARHLHLGQEDLADLADADLKAIRDAGLTLGLSTHDDEELATALRAKPDYVALGPIFPTTLKSMRFAPQGIPKIAEWKKRGLNFGGLTEGFRGYDGITTIAAAIREAGSTEPDKIRQAFWKVKVNGLNGPIAFEPEGPKGQESGQSKPSVYIVQIKDGKVTLLQ